MKNTISISPLTRIEGHLAVRAKTESTANDKNKKEEKVTEAYCEGELFRGFETILKGRDPLDAQQITHSAFAASVRRRTASPRLWPRKWPTASSRPTTAGFCRT